jgi:hypothetical protein
VKIVFLCGPMSGLPHNNYPAFNREARRLRAMGYHVENPAENRAPPGREWSEYMRMSISQLMTCDVVALLPGWEQSKGATLEHHVAKGLGIPVIAAHEVDALLEAAA